MPKPINTTASYMKEVFQDSLITGVSQIVQTRNILRKIIKTIVLLACIVGFVYQTTEFMKIFYSYPTVMDIDVQYPDIIESPAITFCNLNGLKRLPFCNKYPGKCKTPEDIDEFCKHFPNYCDKDRKDLKFPVEDALESEQYSSPEELTNMGHQSNVTLRHCMMRPVYGFNHISCSRDDELHLTVNDGHTGYRNCYTLFSNINSSLLNRYKLPVTKTKEPLFHMAFNLEPGQYFRPDRQVGAIVGIHSPNTIINPFFDGFVIKPGNLYTVHLKVVEEKLLPHPYDTRCKDYKEVWQSRGGKGPLNQDVCVSECVYNTSVEHCKCVQRDLLYPHEERICDEDELDCLSTHINVSKCFEACPQPCDFTDFEYDVMERKLEDASATSIQDFYSKDAITRDHASVLIFLKRPEIVVYSHRPQYEEIEVFSFLGGYVGMWLGISLVAVFDFFESIGLIFTYWLRRRLAKNE